MHKPHSSRHVAQKEKKRAKQGHSPYIKGKKPTHIMSPNHPRGQRSHGEIINRNAKGMGDRETNLKKIIVIYR